MPKSRKQKSSERPSRQGGWRPPDRPYRSIASQMTPAYDRAVEEGADAELLGDAATALRRHRSVPMFRRSTHGDRLDQLATLGPDAPGWMVNRWLTIQARRRSWTGGDPQAVNRTLQLVVPLLYPDGIPIERIGCDHVEQVLPFIYERDWAARQLDVYDMAGLRRVVELHAAPELLDRCDRIEDWCAAPMRALRVEYVDPHRREPIRVTDLAGREELELLDLGAPVEPGQHVLGRVVPVGDGPGLMFDWGALPVREPVALAVAADPRRWLPTLQARTLRGEVEAGDTHRPEAALTSDLPYRAWLSLVGVPLEECPDHDPQPRIATVLEKVLMLADDGHGAVAPHRHLIGDLLLDPLFDDRLRWRYVGPERRSAWELLAEVVPAHARAVCSELALWCSAAPDRPDAIA